VQITEENYKNVRKSLNVNVLTRIQSGFEVNFGLKNATVLLKTEQQLKLTLFKDFLLSQLTAYLLSYLPMALFSAFPLLKV